MNIRTEEWQSWSIASVEGRFGVRFVAEFRKTLEDLSERPFPKIALDLSKAAHLDSSALNVILIFQLRLKKKSGCVVLFGANEDNMNIIKTIGVDSVVPIYNTRLDFERNVAAKQV